MNNTRIVVLTVGAVLGLWPSPGGGADNTVTSKPRISLKTTTEDQKKVIVATVTLDGKPKADLTVNFYVKRLFGNLDIGHDQTLDDGTAAVAFPADLPGDQSGRLHVIAAITNPESYKGSQVEMEFEGAAVKSAGENEFPRALWTPQAPAILIVTVLAILFLVWGTYGYVVVQLVKIRAGGER
jgi:hypothetical protein